ncbi:carbohydrate-binding family 9-like protein [Cecembia rubra]|uniref:Cellulose/xylan binding protein with CBM9 domain n=1 Tax=Cecembia rubra TaxID=1485585 RepID=A0A2P8ECT0_9BACT|nr:carbohydrate-binding family 9-like protein [Cecembia rubra]PSL07273.1 cellulose/xylan binding protein with CBM9 domain [Cecembia rubra]
MEGRAKKLYYLILLGIFSLSFSYPSVYDSRAGKMGAVEEYFIHKLEGDLLIDGNWDKPQWHKADAIHILNNMGQDPGFFPKTQAKLLYDEDHLYGIFQVMDKYVKSVVEDINGPVYTDSCVEFFFSPDENNPLYYFNLEINCGGVALMQFSTEPHKKFKYLLPSDIEKIEIAHSLPKKVFPEIQDEVVWTIEFKMPLNMLSGYSKISDPKPGVVWKGNFYKTATFTSNPHYITWSYVDRPKPDFHLPQFFGTLIFQ